MKGEINKLKLRTQNRELTPRTSSKYAKTQIELEF